MSDLVGDEGMVSDSGLFTDLLPRTLSVFPFDGLADTLQE